MPEGIDKVHRHLEEKAKAAVLLIRLDPDAHRRPKRELGAYEGIVAYSKICTHVGCPVGAVRAADPPPAVPVPPVDVRRDRRTARSSSARPSGRCPSCRSRSTRRDTWSRRATSTSPSARASGSVDEHRPTRATPPRLGRRTTSTSASGAGKARQGPRPQDLPRPLVVHARRDRALQLHHPAAHRHVPDVLLRAERRPRSIYNGSYAPLRRPDDVRGLRLDAATSRSTSAAACSCGRSTTGRR